VISEHKAGVCLRLVDIGQPPIPTEEEVTNQSAPKTIAEWRSERRKKAKQESGYIRIPMELWNGEAFHALTKSEKLVLLECLAQLRYAPKSKKKRQGLSIFKCGLGDLLNNGEFGLPTKYLQERGIKGQDTIARAKKKLVQLGFLDVVTQGSFTKAGRFRYSDRWRTYNSGALFSETGTPSYDGPLPGYCHHANIAQYNAIRALEATEIIADDNPRQLDLFTDYAHTAERRSHQRSTGDMVHI
jgi:hypothetical protein